MNKKGLACLIVSSMLGGITASVHASSVSINNPGFELPVLSNGSWNSSINGWAGSGGIGTWNPNSPYFTGPEAPEGSNVAYINTGSFSQILTGTYQANRNYDLTFDSGWRKDMAAPQFTAQLLAGTTALASLTNPVMTKGSWSTYHLSLLATSVPHGVLGTPIGIKFTRTGGGQVDIDAVALTATPAVPEPENYAMLVAGLGLMSLVARRRKPHAA